MRRTDFLRLTALTVDQLKNLRSRGLLPAEIRRAGRGWADFSATDALVTSVFVELTTLQPIAVGRDMVEDGLPMLTARLGELGRHGADHLCFGFATTVSEGLDGNEETQSLTRRVFCCRLSELPTQLEQLQQVLDQGRSPALREATTWSVPNIGIVDVDSCFARMNARAERAGVLLDPIEQQLSVLE